MGVVLQHSTVYPCGEVAIELLPEILHGMNINFCAV